MPLPNDQRVVTLANDILQMFDTIFGLHPGHRPAHAKGAMLTGTFTPSAQAPSLTKAAHANRPSTPVTIRFSNSTGLPMLPDNAPEASPRGLAVRFNLGDHVHTDLVMHSTDAFPVQNGDEFLEFLKAVAASGAGRPPRRNRSSCSLAATRPRSPLCPRPNRRRSASPRRPIIVSPRFSSRMPREK